MDEQGASSGTQMEEKDLELNLARDIKDNKKGFFKYIKSKWKTRESMGPLLNEVGSLLMEDAEKVELLNAFFASVFRVKSSPQESQALEVREEAAERTSLPWLRKIVRETI